jgi:polysaccharide export outer membrane protein
VRLRIALVAALVCLTACTTTDGSCGPAAAQDADIASYELGPGDLVRVTVFRQPDLSGQFRLDGDGTLALPLAGEVQAGGLTTRDLEQAIAASLLEGDYLLSPQVSVEVLTYRPFYILGEINRPGQYEYKNGMTVINGVALAGGFTYRAKTGEASIERGTCTLGAQADTPVLPGDIIRVPERFF